MNRGKVLGCLVLLLLGLAYFSIADFDLKSILGQYSPRTVSTSQPESINFTEAVRDRATEPPPEEPIRVRLVQGTCNRPSECLASRNTGDVFVDDLFVRNAQLFVNRIVANTSGLQSLHRRLPYFPFFEKLKPTELPPPNEVIGKELRGYFNWTVPSRNTSLEGIEEDPRVHRPFYPFGAPSDAYNDDAVPWVNKDGSDLPYTEFAQQRISRSQSLAGKSCSESRLFVSVTREHFGVGAAINLAAHSLGHAMLMNRLLVFSPHWKRWTGERQGECSNRGWNCFFIPPSSCSFWVDVMPHKLAKVEERDKCVTGELSEKRILSRKHFRNADLKLTQLPNLLPDNVTIEGFEVETRLSYTAWAKAQLVRYLLRGLQPWAESMIQTEMERSGFPFVGKYIIASHIRNGEALKDRELASILGCAKLDISLQLLLLEFLASKCSTYGVDVQLFLSYDEPSAIDDAKWFWGNRSHLSDRIVTAKFPTFKMKKSGSKFDSRLSMKAAFGSEHLMKVSLVNLYLSAAADAWVNNDGSNWGQIINLLRLTASPSKENGPYIDIVRLAKEQPSIIQAFCNVQPSRRK